MLTRLQFCKRDLRFLIRCFADKPPDNDGKTPEQKSEKLEVEKKSSAKFEDKSSTDKIQDLLKQMLAEPKISEKEYRENFATAPERPLRHKNAADGQSQTEQIEESLTKAASEVAKAIGGDVKHTEAELLSKVLGKINQNSTSLSDLLIGMKVDHTKDTDDLRQKPARTPQVPTRGQQVKRLTERANVNASRTRYTQRREDEKDTRVQKNLPQATIVNIFTGEPLGIFKKQEANYGTKLDLWEALNQREVTLATTQPPRNYFEKMILWTEQGKVWKFPIDNEQGMEEEQNVHFSEHVFLDSHLDEWCPKKGPIRHFMELVCVGLSKNAFYTVKEKRDHIAWYREYFESKKDLLDEVGAWDIKPKSEATT